MKRSLILVTLTICSALSVLLGSLITADKTKYRNDFVRVFPPHAADLNCSVATQKQFFIAGFSNDHVYLRDRLGILTANVNLKDTFRIDLDIPFGAEVLVDSPYFFIHHGSQGMFQRGDLSNCKIDTTFAVAEGFSAIQPLSANESVFRTVNISARQNFLTTQNGLQKYILKKQIDGLICTDGFLLYAKELKQFVYLYRYRNTFVCLDACLDLIHEGHTIDTTSVAKITVAEIDGKITLGKPPLNVNNDACVDGKYLFVSSNLTAKNEIAELVKDKTVIDVYNILDGSYRFSFYIANDGSKMQEFRVSQNKLLALFKNSISIYDLPAAYLP